MVVSKPLKAWLQWGSWLSSWILWSLFAYITSHTDLLNGHYIKSRIMVKKSLNTPSASSSRGHKHPRGSGRPPGRGFTGHKGRGSARDYTGQGVVVGAEERPESAVDEPSDEEGSTEGADLVQRLSCAHKDHSSRGRWWRWNRCSNCYVGELFINTLLEDSPILISCVGFRSLWPTSLLRKEIISTRINQGAQGRI